MRRARSEDGFALVAAIVLLGAILSVGIGLLTFADAQQRASTREQSGESAFNLAEAALNTQVGQISREWPASEEAETKEKYPRTCTPGTSTATNGCPDPASLTVGYPTTGAACPAGTPADTWGSPVTNKWTTYVRDDVGQSPYFNSAAEQTAATWDKNGDGKVWVRSVGIVNCRVVTLTELVAAQYVPTNFPHDAFAANWFTITNNGNKTMIDRKGNGSQPGGGNARCANPHPAECSHRREGQIEPEYEEEPPGPSSTMSAVQLEELKAQAKSEGHFYSGSAGNCPTTVEGLSGRPTYIEGCGELSFNGGTGNSEASPGFLVLADGTLYLGGNATFYGVIYAVNKQNSEGAVVTLHANAHVIGAIGVDGNGGIEFGSSHENLKYDPTAINELKVFAGAAATRNSFRVLPINQ
jgi:type II secretory pathway pseudopilin PulG